MFSFIFWKNLKTSKRRFEINWALITVIPLKLLQNWNHFSETEFLTGYYVPIYFYFKTKRKQIGICNYVLIVTTFKIQFQSECLFYSGIIYILLRGLLLLEFCGIVSTELQNNQLCVTWMGSWKGRQVSADSIKIL